MKKTVVFRADASYQIGSGHIMRCLTLAEGLRKKGYVCVFVCQKTPGHLFDLIRKKKFQCHEMKSKSRQISPEEDAKNMVKISEYNSWDVRWVIVDHYQLGLGWEKTIKNYYASAKLLVIDDYLNRSHFCDLFLNQNIFSSKPKTKINASAPKLLGPQYVLLRSEFLKVSKKLKNNSSFPQILIFFGGTDPTHETEKILKAIIKQKINNIGFKVVVGKNNPRYQKIKALCKKIKNAHYDYQTDQMAKTMAQCDLAVGAGGTTSWERAYLGLPTLIVTVAKNQDDIAKNLAKMGAVIYLGSHQRVTGEKMVNAFIKIISSRSQLLSMQKKSKTLVDGLGVLRVIKAMQRITQ